MRFRTRLALAMLAVVLVATAVGLALNARQVRAAYRATLQDLFESGARSVIAVRDAELAAVRVRCARLASLPRVVGAFESGDRGALEGVAELVRALAGEPGVELGLLTGNYPATGRLKVRHAGLDPDVFKVNAFAMDGVTRRDLPPVALQRYAERHGSPLDPARAIIIGDTPKDVDCALHNGCRVLGVATGEFSADDLRACGAHHVVDKLSPVGPVLEWLLSHREAR